MGKWDALYGFWFGELSEERGEVREFWFSGSPEIDRKLAALFSEDYNRALEGSYDDWRSSVRGCLTLIILGPTRIFQDRYKGPTNSARIHKKPMARGPYRGGEIVRIFALSAQ